MTCKHKDALSVRCGECTDELEVRVTQLREAIASVLVCGGRFYGDEGRVGAVLDRLHAKTPITLLIHGACGWDADLLLQERPMRGADAWADGWALERRVKLHRVPARWEALGAKAGPIRNDDMLANKPDLVIAFSGNKGTRDMVGKAHRAGVPVLEV